MVTLSAEQLFEEKQGLIFLAIKQKYGSLQTADGIAKKNNVELQDLIQIARLRLWKICKEYNQDLNDSFNGYVIQSVKWAIISYLRRYGKPIYFSDWCTKEKMQSFEFQSIDVKAASEGEESDSNRNFFAICLDDPCDEAVDKVALKEALAKLSDTERFVLIQRSLGFSDAEIGRMIGVERRQTTRIKNRALLKVNPDFKPDNSKMVPVGNRAKLH